MSVWLLLISVMSRSRPTFCQTASSSYVNVALFAQMLIHIRCRWLTLNCPRSDFHFVTRICIFFNVYTARTVPVLFYMVTDDCSCPLHVVFVWSLLFTIFQLNKAVNKMKCYLLVVLRMFSIATFISCHFIFATFRFHGDL